MSDEVNVIWRKGEGEMPEKVKRVVEAAQDELLLRSLHLPFDIVDMIRYNASKNNQTVNDYIATIVKSHIQPA
jgi:type II secretory pathway component PulC